MPEIRAIQTDPDTLKTVVSEVVEEQLKKQKELENKDKQIQKILKRDSVASEANKKSKENHDTCPNCHNDFEKLDDTMSKCTSCGSTAIKKGAGYLICEDCNGMIPISYEGTDKPCPHCGGTKARKP